MKQKKKKLLIALLVGIAVILSFQCLWRSESTSLHDLGEKIQRIEISKPDDSELSIIMASAKSINNYREPENVTTLNIKPIISYREPMVLSLSYWEQTGNSLSNLFDLQCWANSVGISKVLEPSIQQNGQSTFHFVREDKKYLKFSDLFDIDHWNSMSSYQNYSQLTSMEYFLERASKDLVLVQIQYTHHQFSCRELQEIKKDKWYQFLTQRGFCLVGTVCIDINQVPSRNMEWSTFRDLVLKYKNATVLFDEWRGIRSPDNTMSTSRLDLMGSKCTIRLPDLSNGHFVESKPASVTYLSPHSISPIVPSALVLGYLKRFMDKYSLSGVRYIAVMLRTQKIRNLDTNGEQMKAILSDWKSLKESHNLTTTLLFTDVGKHGSLDWKNPYAKKFSEDIGRQLRLSSTPDQVNSALEEITGSDDSVQIALLQRLLVTHATCIILAGGGTFQVQTLNMYLHSHRDDGCYSHRRGPHFSPAFMEKVNGYVPPLADIYRSLR